MKLLLGKPVAEKILGDIEKNIADFKFMPHLAVILVGDDPASQLYVSLKEKEARKIGIEVSTYKFLPLEKEETILTCIKLLNNDEEINGIIVQLPLPDGFDTQKIISAIDPKKDVDGFHPQNTQAFITCEECLWPVFPHAIVRLIESSGQNVSGKHGIVIANSKEFGEVMQTALQKINISAHYVLANAFEKQKDVLREADVVVSAVGLPGLLTGNMFKDGAIVIDGGIKKVDDKTVGDVDFASTEGKEGFLTPVPGGVGPVTIACLLENVYLAFKAQQKEKES